MEMIPRRRAQIIQWTAISLGAALSYILFLPILLGIMADRLYDNLPGWVWIVVEVIAFPLTTLYDSEILGYDRYIDWLEQIQNP